MKFSFGKNEHKCKFLKGGSKLLLMTVAEKTLTWATLFTTFCIRRNGYESSGVNLLNCLTVISNHPLFVVVLSIS